MYKIIVGIHTCVKNAYRIERIKEILEKKQNKKIKFYFVYGNNKNSTLFKNNIHLKCPESYERLPEKTISFLKFIDKNVQYTHVIKMDDDIFLNYNVFVKFIKQIINYDYVGFFHGKKALKNTPRTYHFNKCSDNSYNEIIYEPYNYDFCNGACCFLSKKAVRFILKNYKNNFEYLRSIENKKGSEDRMIGQILTAQPGLDNIKILKNGKWESDGKNIFSTFNSSVFHPIIMKKNLQLIPLKTKFIYKYLLK